MPILLKLLEETLECRVHVPCVDKSQFCIKRQETSQTSSLYNYANAEIVVQISTPLREFRRCFSAKMVVGGPLRSLERPKDNKKKNAVFVARNPGSTRVYIGVHAGLCPLRLDSAHSGRGGGCYGSINVSGWALCLVARKRALKSPSPFNNSGAITI